jgi:hypothetical protein
MYSKKWDPGGFFIEIDYITVLTNCWTIMQGYGYSSISPFNIEVQYSLSRTITCRVLTCGTVTCNWCDNWWLSLKLHTENNISTQCKLSSQIIVHKKYFTKQCLMSQYNTFLWSKNLQHFQLCQAVLLTDWQILNLHMTIRKYIIYKKWTF